MVPIHGALVVWSIVHFINMSFSSLLLSILSEVVACSSEQKCGKRRSRNKRRSKKRRLQRKKLKYLKMHSPWTNCVPQRAALSGGECYWKNYNNAIVWQRNYIQGYINGCNLSSRNSVATSRFSLDSRDYESTLNTSFFSNLTGNCQADYSEEEDVGGYEEEEFVGGSDEEEDVGVSEEWMAFLEESMKHKEARRLERKHESTPEDETGKDLGRDDIEDCQAPKECMVDGLRLKEMTKLYGKHSSKILGMETAIQLTFNKNCDYYKPPYWPVVPLRIKFKD